MTVTVSGILRVVVVFFITTANRSLGHITDDYCWRDYNGVAPSDALKGGTDKTGRPIYVGQTLYDKKLIPGKIHENSTEIHIEYKDVHVLDKSIKILCTPHPEKFEWVKTKYEELIDMKDKHIFEGGYEKGVKTYIGRAISHGEMTIGKVICWPDRCIRLTTIEDGKWYDHEEYEVLTYNSASIYEDEPHTAAASAIDESEDGPSAITYVFLVTVTALLILIVILLVRRC